MTIEEMQFWKDILGGVLFTLITCLMLYGIFQLIKKDW